MGAHLSVIAEQSLSVAKALTILKIVAAAESPMSVSEIVAGSGFGKTVVLRMLATLHAYRLLERDTESSRYFLGPGLVAMAQTAVRVHPLVLAARSLLEEAVNSTGDGGLLLIEDGRRSLCIESLTGKHPVSALGTDIGTRSPLHCGAGPFALLAFQTDDYIDRYLSGPLEKPAALSVTDPDLIWEKIRATRRRGYAVGKEDLFEFVVAVAVPIFSPSGTLLGSMSVGGINQRFTDERITAVGQKLVELTSELLPDRWTDFGVN